MVNLITPNRAVAFAVGGLAFYVVLAITFSPIVLRDVFNSLSFAVGLLIVITWFKAAWHAVREGADSGEWQLILAIFIVWSVATMARMYSIVFNWMGRPEAWAQSALSGFWPYAFMMAGLLFLAAPGVTQDGLRPQAVWTMVLAVGLGGLIAGILIGASISTSF